MSAQLLGINNQEKMKEGKVQILKKEMRFIFESDPPVFLDVITFKKLFSKNIIFSN